MVSKYKTNGWYKESYRHSLARRGISTSKSKPIDYQAIPFLQILPVASPKQIKARQKLGKKDVIDKFQDFITKKFKKAKAHSPHLSERQEIINAEKDLSKINSFQKFREWYLVHEKTVNLLAIGGIFGILGALGGGVPVLAINAVSGEALFIGGTAVGQAGAVGNVVFTGLAVHEEAKNIDIKELVGEEQVENIQDLIVETPQEKVLVVELQPKKTPVADMAKSEDSEFEDLSKISSPRILPNDLSDEEQFRIKMAVNQVRDTFARMGKYTDVKAEDIHIVKRVGKDDTAWGASQGNLIQIDRDIIKDEDKLQSVLTHEVLHKEYDVRDKTRELENIQMDIIGELMENGVKQERN